MLAPEKPVRKGRVPKTMHTSYEILQLGQVSPSAHFSIFSLHFGQQFW